MRHLTDEHFARGYEIADRVAEKMRAQGHLPARPQPALSENVDLDEIFREIEEWLEEQLCST